MLNRTLAMAMLLLVVLVAACGQVTGETDDSTVDATAVAPSEAAQPGTGMGQGMGQGMGRGMGQMGMMRTAHHATIPEPYAGLTNPVPATEESLERGAEIYSNSCAVCHGDGGMGDGPAAGNLDPAPAAIAHTSQMLSDAYLFWRISEGGQGDPITSSMPAWKSTLDEQARWDVINYIQALGAGTMQPRMMMGGAMFDPAIEQQNRREMVDEAIAAGLIDAEQAETFLSVHDHLDELMLETGLRMQGNNLPALLAILVERETISQAEADSFAAVHDLLIEAGLMR